MRQTEVSLAAVGFSVWVPHDVYQTPPAISLIATLSSGANLTYSVQGTGDDISSAASRFAGWSQTASTAVTITDIGPPARGGTHGLSAADYVLVLNGPDGSAPGLQGYAYAVTSITDGTHYVITSPNSRTFTGEVQIITARVFNNPQLTALAANGQGSWAFPVKGSRLVLSTWAAGVASLVVLQGENK